MITTRAEDRYVTNVIVRNRFVTGPETRRRLFATRGPGARSVSVKNVRDRIHAGGFKSRVPAKKPELSQRHKNARIAFSRAHVGWNSPQWRRVMFSDELRFYLKRVDGRKRDWRRRRERHVPAIVIPIVAFQGGGVMVWPGFQRLQRQTSLHRRKPECTTLHQRSPYASRAAVPAPDASRQYNVQGR